MGLVYHGAKNEHYAPAVTTTLETDTVVCWTIDVESTMISAPDVPTVPCATTVPSLFESRRTGRCRVGVGRNRAGGFRSAGRGIERRCAERWLREERVPGKSRLRVR